MRNPYEIFLQGNGLPTDINIKEGTTNIPDEGIAPAFPDIWVGRGEQVTKPIPLIM